MLPEDRCDVEWLTYHRMKKYIVVAVLSTLLCAASGRTVTDALGRAVQLPDVLERVIASSKLGTMLLYTINPTCLAGVNSAPSKADACFLEPDFLTLPVLGGWSFSGAGANKEEVLKADPELLVYVTFLPSRRAATLAQVKRIEQTLHIPVVVVDGTFDVLPETYRLLGQILDETARTEPLARYAECTLSDVRARAAAIPPDQVVRVYYADGNDGLMTDPAGSIHTRLFEMVGARNVLATSEQGLQKRTKISPEQLLIWDPDLILVYHAYGTPSDNSTWSRLQTDSRLKTLSAIRAHEIYEVPYRPVNLMDHPPSISRLLGIKWLGQLIYPEFYPYDLNEESRRFFRLFYRVEISPEQLANLFEHATRS